MRRFAAPYTGGAFRVGVSKLLVQHALAELRLRPDKPLWQAGSLQTLHALMAR